MSTHTYKGLTGRAIVSRAKIEQMGAGNYEATVTINGATLVLNAKARRNGWGDLVYPATLILSDVDGPLAELELCARGRVALGELIEQAMAHWSTMSCVV